MTSALWRMIMILSFGRNAERPVRAAYTRIATAVGASILMGLLTAQTLTTLPLPSGLPALWTCAVIAWGTFAVGVFTLLAIAGFSKETNQREAILHKLIATLPFTYLQRWLTYITPPAIIVIVVLIFCTPVIITLGNAFGTPWVLSVGAMALGLLSGFGFALIRRPESIALKAGIFIGVIGLSGFLLENSLRAIIGSSSWHWPVVAFYVLMTLCLGGFWHSYRHANTLYQNRVGGRTHTILPLGLLPMVWFVINLLRNPRTLGSLLFCLVVSLSTAGILWARKLPVDASWLMFAAMLVAAFACDVRGLSPRYKAPQVVLNGPGYFIRQEYIGTLLLGVLISLPLGIMAVISGAPVLDIIGLWASLLIAAASVGLLASTIFVPRGGDIGAQFFAAGVALSVLFGLPTIFHPETTIAQILTWILASAIAAACTYVIELTRRRNYGRA